MIDYTRLSPLVKRVARAAGSAFPAEHDHEDTEQSLWVWVFENKNTVLRICTHEENPEAVLHGLLLKAANSHLKAEDAQAYNYAPEDVFNYSRELIESILEVVFEHQDWVSFATALDKMPKGKADPATAGNNLASYADVKSAAERLPEDQYNTVIWRYKYKYTFEAIGAEFGITKQGAQSRLMTALDALQRDLGRGDLDSLRRPVQTVSRPSTASVVARVERDYEG